MKQASALDAINIETEPFIDTNSVGGAQAILCEIETMLERFIANNEEGVIDLKGIPLTHDEYQQLQYVLGGGELSATIHALGKSIVRETAIAGAWWITHYNEDDGVIADMLEVTSIPAILKSDRGDMRNALIELRKRIEKEQPLIV
ncbi:MAG: hydrogenase expression/formation protein [Gammaproteobacteria bacterium]|nr:hydrogenase expression/formation protein [Gammaproteobacteria bacterium]